MPRVPQSRPFLGGAELRAVARVVRSGQLAAGREVARLEAEFAERFGFRQAVAVSSGSAALHLALIALGVGPGDRVITPSYVCVAVLNAIRYRRAREVLVDVEPGGFQLDAAAAVRLAPRARVLIVPHLFGYAAEVAPLARTGIPVIEDCAMALGASHRRRAAGRSGRIAVYSFYATKPLAAGEGGLVATDDEALAAEVRDLRSYDKKDVWRLRYNYQLTDLQAAVARAQLRRLGAAVARRREIAETYFQAIDPGLVSLPPRREGATYHRFVVGSGAGFAAACRHFRRLGIDVVRPVHQPLHRALGLDPRRFPRAERLFLTAFSLPIYPSLSHRDAMRISQAVNALGSA